MKIGKLKKISALTCAMLALGMISMSTYASDDSAVLATIADKLETIKQTTNTISTNVTNTYNFMLNQVNNFMIELTQTSTSVRAVDATAVGQVDSKGNPLPPDPIVDTFATPFAVVGSSLAGIKTSTDATSLQFDNSLFSSLKTGTVPSNAADLVYSSLRGAQTQYIPAPTGNGDIRVAIEASGLNYVANASGYNIPHKSPQGLAFNPNTPDARKRYVSFYTTVIPAQSFGASVLSARYAEELKANNAAAVEDAKSSLLTMATDQANWFATIASEDIGKVLRQILMFESQNYVVSSQLLETQKKILTAQVMTNAILIASAQWTEKEMYEDSVKRGA